MASITELEQDLAQTNRHIVEGRARIARRYQIMRRLEVAGHDTKKARDLVRELEDGLEVMLAHHQRIARELSKVPGEAV
jgi:hypothetical protein